MEAAELQRTVGMPLERRFSEESMTTPMRFYCLKFAADGNGLVMVQHRALHVERRKWW